MTAGCYAQARAPGAFRSIGGAPLGAAAQLLQRGRPGRSAAPHHGPGTRSHPMPAPAPPTPSPCASSSTPTQGGIARLTSAVERAAGTVTAVDVVESQPDRMVVDPTGNARDADHAEQLTKAVGRLDGVELRTVSDRNLTFLHSPTPRLTRQAWPSEQPPCWGEGGWRELLAAVRPACRTDAQAASVQVGGPTEYYGYQGSPRRWRGSPGSRRCSQTGQSQVRVLSGSPDLPLCEPRAAGHRPHHPPGCPTHQRWPR
jgi:hypothetical protein